MAESAGLFENQREVNLSSTITMIEDVLIELGHFVNECRTEVPGTLRAWRIQKGTATVRISLVDRDDFTHLRAASAVMHLDAAVSRSALYAHLLEQNAELTGAAFALKDDVVFVLAERTTLDLDRSEVKDLIDRVQTYADEHDEPLVERFGGALGGDVENLSRSGPRRPAAAGSARLLASARPLVEVDPGEDVRAHRQLVELLHDATARVNHLDARQDGELDPARGGLDRAQVAGDGGTGVVLDAHLVADEVVELRVVRHGAGRIPWPP